jgi:hypothetical protein
VLAHPVADFAAFEPQCPAGPVLGQALLGKSVDAAVMNLQQCRDRDLMGSQKFILRIWGSSCRIP